MAQSLSAPFLVRARRAVLLLLPALLVAAVAGCGHRRSSMRPVYVGPAATPSCPTTVAPSVPSSATTVEPEVIEPASAAPLGRSPMPSAPSTSSLPPAASATDTPPPVTGPSLPGSSEEPGLEPVPPESSKVPNLKNSSPGTPSSPPRPSAFKGSNNGRRTASGRSRQAALGERVQPFLNDPEELFLPPKADRPWKYVVLHHSASEAGSYDSIDREHRKRLGWDGCGYHFVIGNGSESPDGQIEVSQRWLNQKHGVHCRDGKNPDVNEYGIGICLVGDLEKSPPTERQIASARALVAYLSGRYQIPADHTETHAHLAASPTSCPGRLFPTQAIIGTKGLTLR